MVTDIIIESGTLPDDVKDLPVRSKVTLGLGEYITLNDSNGMLAAVRLDLASEGGPIVLQVFTKTLAPRA